MKEEPVVAGPLRTWSLSRAMNIGSTSAARSRPARAARRSAKFLLLPSYPARSRGRCERGGGAAGRELPSRSRPRPAVRPRCSGEEARRRPLR